MSLWNTRNKAIAEFDGPLKVEAEVLNEAFDLLDECVVRLEAEHGSEPYSRVCALTLIKGRNLLLGSYGLSLDGLAQEAGALLRPFIEVFEKMVYFNEDPSRIEEAIEGRLPKAGEIAKRIQGQFKALREHLNEHSSHLGFTDDSANHVNGCFLWAVKIKISLRLFSALRFTAWSNSISVMEISLPSGTQP